MKRLTLLVVLLAAVGVASGFALEVKPAFSLSGNATLTWGVDLDNVDTGFKNSASGDFTVTLVADGSSDTHVGSGPVYGSITISDLELYWKDGLMYVAADKNVPTEATFAAKLVFGNFDLSIYGAPAMNSEGAPAIEDGTDSFNAIIDAVLLEEPSFTFGAYDSGQGTQLKYHMGDNWLAFDIVSADSYDDAATVSNYAVGAQASMVFKPVTLGLGVFQGVNYAANPTGGYLTLAADIASVGTAKVGVDVQYDFITSSGFELDLYAQADMYFNKDKTAYLEGKVYYNQSTTNFDSALVFMVPADTLFGAVNFDIYFWALDLSAATKTFALESHLGYNMKLGNGMLVAPTVFVDFSAVGGVLALQLGPQVVVTLAKAPDTTLTVAYTSGDLMATPAGKGSITAALEVAY